MATVRTMTEILRREDLGVMAEGERKKSSYVKKNFKVFFFLKKKNWYKTQVKTVVFFHFSGEFNTS